MKASGFSRAASALLLSAACLGASQLIACGGDAEPERSSEIATESAARRLSTVELDNTLRDLLGDDTNAASRVLVSDQYSPYDNDIALQAPSEALITSLEFMAGDVADRFTADADRMQAFLGCTPTGADDAVCLRTFVESWVPVALRRPLEEGEADRYLGLQSFAIEANQYVDNGFATAVNLIVRAVLQQPEFLYRIETGTKTDNKGVRALDDWQIAARLSYLLWGTMPDQALRDDALAGRLTNAETRYEVAERMLTDDRAKLQMRRFHAMWLGHRILPQPAELVRAFSNETGALIDRVIFDEPQSYYNMLTMPETYLDNDLADHYGLPRPEGGEGWVTYEGPARAGILSHGSVLASFAKFADTSPTQRGILIRTRLMCDTIDPPPPTLDVDSPPGDAEALCKYDRYAQHRETTSCAACHAEMDPIGFGLENFDMQGRYREHDEGLPECIIAGQGSVPGVGEFSGPKELAETLIESGRLEACIMKNFYQFTIGREIADVEQPVVDALLETFQSEGRDMRALMLSFIGSERFALRREFRGITEEVAP
jgi:hypothetical protein